VRPPAATGNYYFPGIGSHPYHQHVNPFQVVSVNNFFSSINTNVVRVNEWRDTVPLPPDGVTIRFRTSDWTGDMVLHCHLLRHGDHGMMGLVNIFQNQTCIANETQATPGPSSSPSSLSAVISFSTLFLCLLFQGIFVT
jgi:hypothetical protein